MYTAIVQFEDENKRKIFENMTAKEFGQFLVQMSEKYILLYDTSFSEPSVRATIIMTAQPR